MRKRDSQRLIRLYAKQPLPLDQLPYTSNMTSIFYQMPDGVRMVECWLELVRLRKAGLLPRKTPKPQR